MIVEAPDPSCASGSLFLDNIISVRRTLDQRFGAIGRIEANTAVTANLPVTVTGVAFFDTLHGQRRCAKRH
jgi:hypothetical protein